MPLRRPRKRRAGDGGPASSSGGTGVPLAAPKLSPAPDDRGRWGAHVPSQVWCWAGHFLDIRGLGRLMASCRCVVGSSEAQAVWQYHAFVVGCAQPVLSTEDDWVYPYPRGNTNQLINWHHLLRLNAESESPHWVWVRLCDIDLQLPLPAGSATPGAALLQALRFLLRRAANALDAPERAKSADLGRLRLRLLQWSGRPGWVLTSRPEVAQRLIVEWPQVLNSALQWTLPPYELTSPRSSLPASHMARQPTIFGIIGLGQSLVGADPRVGQLASSGPAIEGGKRGLVCLRGRSLLSQDTWLAVDLASSTLQSLYGLITQALERHWRAAEGGRASCRPHFHFKLMDERKAAVVLPWEPAAALRDLRWAESEMLHLAVEEPCPHGPGPPEHSGETIVLVRREAQLQGRRSPALRWARPPLVDAVPARALPKQEVREEEEDDDEEVPDEFEGVEAPSLRHGKAGLERSCRHPTPRHMASGDEGPSNDGVADRDIASHGAESAPTAEESGAYEQLVSHYQPRLLLNTHQVRQFEFHPSLPHILLTGDKRGGVDIVDTEDEVKRQPLMVDSCPVLGLAWMRHHPQSAVCGAAHSGQIRFLKYNPFASASEPALQHVQTLEEFPKLSSLSVNCTDDFLIASGFTHNLALYDTLTGTVIQKVLNVHSHFINITRFANRSPHIFATASFDHTCKVWDLRRPLLRDSPLKVLNTGGLNVMCTFSPDDRHLLCSGVDTRIAQFEVPSFEQVPKHFPLRPAVHTARYRRSMYFAGGKHFVTAATDESHIRVMSAEGRNLGIVDFRGILSHVDAARSDETKRRCFRSRLGSMRGAESVVQYPDGIRPCTVREEGELINGKVILDNDGVASADGRESKEYVQSVRTHPVVDNRIGVLLSSYHPHPQSYIAFVHLDPSFSTKCLSDSQPASACAAVVSPLVGG